MQRRLAALSLLFVGVGVGVGACGSPPEDDRIDDVARAAQQPPPGNMIPLPGESLINFDTTPAGVAIASGAAVDTLYASKGVTFSCVYCTAGGGGGSAHAIGGGAPGNNYVKPAPGTGFVMFDSRDGGVRAEFATPRQWVTIEATRVLSWEDLTGASTAKPWLEGYDASGALIYQTYWDPAGTQTQVLVVGSYLAPATIKYVLFSSQNRAPPGYGAFDNLRFNSNERPRPRP